MEEEKIDPVYKQGFSNGYWIETGRQKGLADSQEFKDFIGIVEKIKHPTYLKGIEAGQAQAKRELIRDAFKAVENTRSRQKDRERD